MHCCASNDPQEHERGRTQEHDFGCSDEGDRKGKLALVATRVRLRDLSPIATQVHLIDGCRYCIDGHDKASEMIRPLTKGVTASAGQGPPPPSLPLHPALVHS